jgi:hypothetical protein
MSLLMAQPDLACTAPAAMPTLPRPVSAMVKTTIAQVNPRRTPNNLVDRADP